ncbi:AGE family epimerase/isomerase [Brevundimonas diminuta]|uniref:Mannose-1-phosphate guanylyltransferase rfbM n=1 Tax=Brevundimonas diminuta TaxID=293 RepID=A0A2X1AU11_BREDI|nr:AGE family epimerase/isomerase [Brevundimonas diminuta]SPU44082.1 Mannose-1-phosphate guanylyltransferase rfbM [Brevundimonas diminuta]
MAFYPVIMCGGAGTRLWPASRPSRPKQFVPLAGNRTLFQEAALRVAPLADGGGRLVVVGGVKHREAIVAQLAEIGLTAQILLEPEARDSAPAMAAAAAWVARVEPDGVVAFVASDHHIPDHEAFRSAVKKAAEGAREGSIVTLGVRPTEPSAAYGYIRPAGRGLSRVERFVEKPDRSVAAEYIRAGYLWNSGNFIARADVLLKEMVRYAPGVATAAESALPMAGDHLQILASSFGNAPRISIDYAVMEKTQHASVLDVDFAWSDLGAWDAIAETGEGDVGAHVLEDTEGCLVRAPDGVLVAALGVRNLAIVVEPDAVLVTELSRAQEVKRIVERIKTISPRHLDFVRTEVQTLGEAARVFARWLRVRSLPIWTVQGQTEEGAFEEVLTLEGRSVLSARRTRVQARQIYVCAEAGVLGWSGNWRRAVKDGRDFLNSAHMRADGLARARLAADGSVLDDAALLYDQAFVLLALASVERSGLVLDARAQAVELRDALTAFEVGGPGLREAGDQPYQSNAHMHLLEACLAWEDADAAGGWGEWSDRVVDLALQHLIDAEGGFLREFYDERWQPAAGEDGRLVEPGHQFEWAWLLARYARRRNHAGALAAARRLYAFGTKGVDQLSGVAVDAVLDDGTVLSDRARLWPQTERLKAALILAEAAGDGERSRLLADARHALGALQGYLTPDGLWRDKRLSSGRFIDEPAPASSMYHIMAAFAQLAQTLAVLGSEDTLLDLR